MRPFAERDGSICIKDERKGNPTPRRNFLWNLFRFDKFLRKPTAESGDLAFAVRTKSPLTL